MNDYSGRECIVHRRLASLVAAAARSGHPQGVRATMRTASRAEASPAQRGFRASAHGSGPQRSGPDAGGRRSPREPVRRRRALFARLRTHHLTHPPPPQVALLLSHDIGGHIMTSHACRPTKMRPSTLGPSCTLPPSTGKGPPAHAPGCVDANEFVKTQTC